MKNVEKALLFILTSVVMIFLWALINVTAWIIPPQIVLFGGMIIGTWFGFLVFTLITYDREFEIDKHKEFFYSKKELTEAAGKKDPVDLAKAAGADASHQDKVNESRAEGTEVETTEEAEVKETPPTGEPTSTEATE